MIWWVATLYCKYVRVMCECILCVYVCVCVCCVCVCVCAPLTLVCMGLGSVGSTCFCLELGACLHMCVIMPVI